MTTIASLNPALVNWTGHEGLPRFEAIMDEDFAPAFDAALASHEAEIEAIADNPEDPTFANTVSRWKSPAMNFRASPLSSGARRVPIRTR